MPVDQLLRRVDAEEQARGPLEYARSVVEYCSHVALRVEARRPDHLGDREFHTLTYDMMLAWEAPDEETDAVFQVRIQIGCLPPPVVRTNRHVILTREIPIKIHCWFFFPHDAENGIQRSPWRRRGRRRQWVHLLFKPDADGHSGFWFVSPVFLSFPSVRSSLGVCCLILING